MIRLRDLITADRRPLRWEKGFPTKAVCACAGQPMKQMRIQFISFYSSPNQRLLTCREEKKQKKQKQHRINIKCGLQLDFSQRKALNQETMSQMPCARQGGLTQLSQQPVPNLQAKHQASKPFRPWKACTISHLWAVACFSFSPEYSFPSFAPLIPTQSLWLSSNISTWKCKTWYYN